MLVELQFYSAYRESEQRGLPRTEEAGQDCHRDCPSRPQRLCFRIDGTRLCHASFTLVELGAFPALQALDEFLFHLTFELERSEVVRRPHCGAGGLKP